MTQAELRKKASLSSDARLSRIINGHEKATAAEIERICAVLERGPTELGF